jgi:hypothetical protein
MHKKTCNFFVISSTWEVQEWFCNRNVKIMNVEEGDITSNLIIIIGTDNVFLYSSTILY